MSPRNLALAVGAPAIWGITFTLAKSTVAHFPPLFMMLLAYAFVAIVMAITHREKFQTSWPRLLLIASLGVTIQGALLFYAIRDVDAVTSNLVLQSQVPAGVIMAWLLAGEKPTLNRLVGMAIALFGIVIVVGLPEKRPPLWPVLMIVISGFAWAAGQVLARSLSKDTGPMTLKANSWFGVPQLLLTSLLFEKGQWYSLASASQLDWLLLGIFCVFGFYVPYMIWFTLLKRVSVDQAVPFILLMTPVGLVTALLFLGETITGIQILGGAVLMLGLAVVSGFRPRALFSS